MCIHKNFSPQYLLQQTAFSSLLGARLGASKGFLPTTKAALRYQILGTEDFQVSIIYIDFSPLDCSSSHPPFHPGIHPNTSFLYRESLTFLSPECFSRIWSRICFVENHQKKMNELGNMPTGQILYLEDI